MMVSSTRRSGCHPWSTCRCRRARARRSRCRVWRRFCRHFAPDMLCQRCQTPVDKTKSCRKPDVMSHQLVIGKSRYRPRPKPNIRPNTRPIPNNRSLLNIRPKPNIRFISSTETETEFINNKWCKSCKYRKSHTLLTKSFFFN